MKSSKEPRAAPAAADVDLELLKAVAQAWHARSGSPRPSRASETGGEEDDDAAGVSARPRSGYRPSRFKLEAIAAAASRPVAETPHSERSWDFAGSLWDTYELVTVARKLESSLVIDYYATTTSPAAVPKERGAWKRGKESGRSLRRLFLRSSSRRFEESKT